MTMRRSNTNIFSKMFIFIFDYKGLYILLMTYLFGCVPRFLPYIVFRFIVSHLDSARQ